MTATRRLSQGWWCGLAAAALALLVPASPAAVKSLDAFAGIPVLDGGRVMPLDSYARLKLLEISGKSTFNRQPALNWMARMWFDPEAVGDDAVILVNHPDILEAMGVPEGKGRRYTYTQLEPGLAKLEELARAAVKVEDSDRTPLERELIRLFSAIGNYSALRTAAGFARPSADFTATNEEVRVLLDLPAGRTNYSFLEVFERAGRMSDRVQEIAHKDREKWTPVEQELLDLSSALFRWSRAYQQYPPAILPVRGHEGEQWFSPWAIMASGFRDEASMEDIGRLAAMAVAWREGKQVEFNLAATALARSTVSRAPPSRSLRHLQLELRHNKFDAFYRAEVLYGFAFLCSLVAILTGSKLFRRGGLGLVFAALVPHTLGLAWRMMIMGRPPVTNLYATFLFVAWICVLLGLALEYLQRNNLGTLLAGVGGLGLLMVSGRFSSQSDTLGVVVAVLDSNFWLATHVVAISIGYAGCVAAGVVGHLYLIVALFQNPDSPLRRSIIRSVYGLLAFGLIFSFLGTMLGGVWADQSWGRFWGWDPKENGALLIVLWCAILLHARIAHLIDEVGMAAGSVLGVIVVLMAWLGINLLGVGLHSYGFTSGLARGFAITVGVELLFVAATVPFVRRAAQPTSFAA